MINEEIKWIIKFSDKAIWDGIHNAGEEIFLAKKIKGENFLF